MELYSAFMGNIREVDRFLLWMLLGTHLLGVAVTIRGVISAAAQGDNPLIRESINSVLSDQKRVAGWMWCTAAMAAFTILTGNNALIELLPHYTSTVEVTLLMGAVLALVLLLSSLFGIILTTIGVLEMAFFMLATAIAMNLVSWIRFARRLGRGFGPVRKMGRVWR